MIDRYQFSYYYRVFNIKNKKLTIILLQSKIFFSQNNVFKKIENSFHGVKKRIVVVNLSYRLFRESHDRFTTVLLQPLFDYK